MSVDGAGALRVVMLAPPTSSSGPIPRLSALLSEAFRARGVEVATEAWGRTSDGTVPNLFGRLRQAWRVRSSLSAPPTDVLFIQTSLEPTSVATDLALLYVCLGRRPATVLLFHGGDAHRLGRADARIFTFATRLLLRGVAAVLVSSSEERALIASRAGHVKCEVVVNPFVPAVRVERSRAAADGTDPAPVCQPARHREGTARRDRRPVDDRPAETLLPDGGRGRPRRGRSAGARRCSRRRRSSRRWSGASVPVRSRRPTRTRTSSSSRRTSPEGFPTVLTEAMAAGLPIVTTPTRGIADHLEDGRNALFVPQRDPVAVARAIERLLDDEDLAARMSLANREKVLRVRPGSRCRALPRGLPRSSRPMSNPCLVDDAGLRAALEHGFRLAEQLDWRSHDPYDLLLSPYARPLATSPFAARAWIQVGKRTGGGVRRILRVPLHREAKALADFLRAAVVLDCLGETAYRLTAGRLEQMLGELRSTTRAGCGWGLSFPYVSRFGPIAMGSPNVYTTTNVCQALLDAEGESGEIPELVAAARRFLIEDLGRFSFGGSLWFRYAPGGTAPIVNVQASAASLFARLGWANADEDSKPFAHEAAATAVGAQRPDGSWPYSVDGERRVRRRVPHGLHARRPRGLPRSRGRRCRRRHRGGARQRPLLLRVAPDHADRHPP